MGRGCWHGSRVLVGSVGVGYAAILQLLFCCIEFAGTGFVVVVVVYVSCNVSGVGPDAAYELAVCEAPCVVEIA